MKTQFKKEVHLDWTKILFLLAEEELEQDCALMIPALFPLCANSYLEITASHNTIPNKKLLQ